MKKLLILGANGQVGRALQQALPSVGEVLALHRLSTPAADLADPAALGNMVRQIKPDAVVNAAAYTQVDKAEIEPEVAHRINAEAPAALAQACRDVGAWLVHYSTDYVFDGSGDLPWREGDATGPLNVYGASKLAGERAITASGCRHLIFRTSWVFGGGQNFIRSILERAHTAPGPMRVVADQIGAPTDAALIADATARALHRSWTVHKDHVEAAAALSGVYHLTAQGHTSWHGLAVHAMQTAQAHGLILQIPPDQVLPIATRDYPSPARRPLNSRLNGQAFRQTFGVTLPPWQAGVDEYVASLVRELTCHP